MPSNVFLLLSVFLLCFWVRSKAMYIEREAIEVEPGYQVRQGQRRLVQTRVGMRSAQHALKSKPSVSVRKAVQRAQPAHPDPYYKLVLQELMSKRTSALRRHKPATPVSSYRKGSASRVRLTKPTTRRTLIRAQPYSQQKRRYIPKQSDPRYKPIQAEPRYKPIQSGLRYKLNPYAIADPHTQTEYERIESAIKQRLVPYVESIQHEPRYAVRNTPAEDIREPPYSMLREGSVVMNPQNPAINGGSQAPPTIIIIKEDKQPPQTSPNVPPQAATMNQALLVSAVSDNKSTKTVPGAPNNNPAQLLPADIINPASTVFPDASSNQQQIAYSSDIFKPETLPNPAPYDLPYVVNNEAPLMLPYPSSSWSKGVPSKVGNFNESPILSDVAALLPDIVNNQGLGLQDLTNSQVSNVDVYKSDQIPAPFPTETNVPLTNVNSNNNHAQAGTSSAVSQTTNIQSPAAQSQQSATLQGTTNSQSSAGTPAATNIGSVVHDQVIIDKAAVSQQSTHPAANTSAIDNAMKQYIAELELPPAIMAAIQQGGQGFEPGSLSSLVYRALELPGPQTANTQSTSKTSPQAATTPNVSVGQTPSAAATASATSQSNSEQFSLDRLVAMQLAEAMDLPVGTSFV